MENQANTQEARDLFDPQMESLKYQLEFLKLEIQSIDQMIERMDEITQTTKNWAIVTWGGSLAIALGNPVLMQFTILTALLPFLFWYIDAQWRRLQRRSTFRVRKIHEFLNDERLAKSFEQKKLVGFTVLDPTGHQYKNTEEYKKATSLSTTIRFGEVRIFYLTLIGISLVLGVFFALVK